MIISRTPYRVSFFGGGSDYPAWFRKHGGAVLATTFNKYCYIFCRWLPPFFEHKHRVVYSQIELPQRIEEIGHPSVRECLKFMEIRDGIEIHHAGDLPSKTGVGTSSSFTVGLLHALYALKGVMPSKRRLADDAIFIEQQMSKENVGCQDQYSAAFGGFNRIDFDKYGEIKVTPITVDTKRLSDHLMLFFTGLSRTASEVAGRLILDMPRKKEELTEMHRMVDEAQKILISGSDLTDFGRLMNESWLLKRSLTNGVSTPYIDHLYNEAISAGAKGGKLCGVGGGGFLLFFVVPERQKDVRERLHRLLEVPFKFENTGSTIIFYEAEQ